MQVIYLLEHLSLLKFCTTGGRLWCLFASSAPEKMTEIMNEAIQTSTEPKRTTLLGPELMDKCEVRGFRSLFDHYRHRNESFFNRYDYRLVLLMVTAADPTTSWRLATLMMFQGISVLIPYFCVTLLFSIPFLFYELFVGGNLSI